MERRASQIFQFEMPFERFIYFLLTTLYVAFTMQSAG